MRILIKTIPVPFWEDDFGFFIIFSVFKETSKNHFLWPHPLSFSILRRVSGRFLEIPFKQNYTDTM
jgi:hypothetical protein